MTVLSLGFSQLNMIDLSPGVPDSPAGAAGMGTGDDTAVVDTKTSLEGPVPAAFWARTCILKVVPWGSLSILKVVV